MPKNPRETPAVDAKSTAQEPPVKSIDKAMRLLKIVAEKPFDGAMFVELAREAGLGKATTHRLLAALVDTGFVFQDPDTRRYRLGSSAVLLGRHAVTQSVISAAQVRVARIAEQTQDTAFASVPEGAVAVCIARELGAFPIRSLALEVGGRRPLGVGAGSLALLAAMTDEHVERVLAWNERAYRAFPAYSIESIRRMVARTRERGFSLNESHVVQGMNAIGVPVVSIPGRPVAALSVSAIAERLSGARLDALVAIVADEARAMSTQLRAIEPIS